MRKRFHLRFGIKWLFLIGFLVGVATLLAQKDGTKWRRYENSSSVTSSCARGKLVVLLVYTNANISSGLKMCRELIQTDEFDKLARRPDVVLMHASIETETSLNTLKRDFDTVFETAFEPQSRVVVFPKGSPKKSIAVELKEVRDGRLIGIMKRELAVGDTR